MWRALVVDSVLAQVVGSKGVSEGFLPQHKKGGTYAEKA